MTRFLCYFLGAAGLVLGGMAFASSEHVNIHLLRMCTALLVTATIVFVADVYATRGASAS